MAMPPLHFDEKVPSPRRNITRLQERTRPDLYERGIGVITSSRPSRLQGIPTSPSIEPLVLVDPESPKSPASPSIEPLVLVNPESPKSPVLDSPEVDLETQSPAPALHDADFEAK